MKPIITVLWTFIVIIAAQSAFAQEKTEKSPIGFSAESISISENDLSAAFEKKSGNRVDISLSDDIIFSGIVINNNVKKGNLHSVMIRSLEDDHSVMQISRQETEPNRFKYVGRILNRNKEEGYKISCDDQGAYSLTRFDATKLIEDCTNTH